MRCDASVCGTCATDLERLEGPELRYDIPRGPCFRLDLFAREQLSNLAHLKGDTERRGVLDFAFRLCLKQLYVSSACVQVGHKRGRATDSSVTVIHEILHVELGLCKDLCKDLGHDRDRREVVGLQSGQFPAARLDGTRGKGRLVVGIVWVCDRMSACSPRLPLRRPSVPTGNMQTLTLVDSIIALVVQPLDHHHTSRMTFEQVVDEGDEHDDARWRRDECEAREALDERGDHRSGEQTKRGQRWYPVDKKPRGTHGEDRKVSRSRKNLARYLTCMTSRSNRP